MDTKTRYKQYQYRSEKKGIIFLISYNQFKILTHRECYICKKQNAKGLDRIDNKLGYYWNNVQPCCFDCNRMKSDKTKLEFLEYLTRLNPNHNLLNSFNRLKDYKTYNKKVNSSFQFMESIANTNLE
jgi:hypothetical protein